MSGHRSGAALRACMLVVLLATHAVASAALVDAIEYYHAGLDHYFVTSIPDEIAKLDSGFFSGWQRTGEHFTVFDAATSTAGATGVCRFYGNPAFGLDSHFYSASPAECAAVQQKFPDAWLLESNNVFQVLLPNTTTGACPANSVPIYRAWNGRADSNHRYTTSAAILQSMVAMGYVAEGYGPASLPVAMCSPTGSTGPSGPVPVCTLSANNPNPITGQSIIIVSDCTGSPTSYAWTGCSSTSLSCTATSATAGVITYSLVATNANGSSAPARLDIPWRPPSNPLPAPQCTLGYTSQTDPPQIGNTLLLNASCSGAPTSYVWTGCPSASSTCYVAESATGPHTYTVVATNEGGPSVPVSITLYWVDVQPPAPDFCVAYSPVLRTTMPFTSNRAISARYTDGPGFAANGVWLVSFTIPANTTATSVRIAGAEFNGPPTLREATLSRAACDFRSVDPSGANGPVGRTTGNSITMVFSIGGSGGLQPGQTYYVAIRNRAPDGTLTCSAQRCDAFLDLSVH